MLVSGRERLTGFDFRTRDLTLMISLKRLSELKDFVSGVYDRVRSVIGAYDEGGSHDHLCFALRDWVEGDTDIELNITPVPVDSETMSLQDPDFSLLRYGLSSETPFMDFRIDCDFTKEREQIEKMEILHERSYQIARWLKRKKKTRDAWLPATAAISNLVGEKYEDSRDYNALVAKCGAWAESFLGFAGEDTLCICLGSHSKLALPDDTTHLFDNAIKIMNDAFDVVKQESGIELLVAQQDLSEAVERLPLHERNRLYKDESRTHRMCESTLLGAGLSCADKTLKDVEFVSIKMEITTLELFKEKLSDLPDRSSVDSEVSILSLALEDCGFHFVICEP